jgi:hypothetical protein
VSQGRRKYEALDIVSMYAKLTPKDWKFFIRRAIRGGSVEKLKGYRYGLQAGLAQANDRNVASETLNIWTIKRIRDVERAMKVILRYKYPNPLDNPTLGGPSGDILDFIHKVKLAKRMRDQEFGKFLSESSF